MSEEYVFEENNTFESLTSRRVKSGVTQFQMHFMHVYRQFWALNRKQNKKGLGKTCLKMWSQICGKIAMLVQEETLNKSCKKVKIHHL